MTASSAATPPRYLPDEPLPPYAYIPRRFPHPTRDADGHSFASRRQPPQRMDAERWRDCRPYLFGVDLFNHGYYWEAHEAWESLWHACGRHGTTADLLKALIRLAAAGFKIKEGKPGGARRHASSAHDIFSRVAGELDTPRHLGLSLENLCEFAAEAALRADQAAPSAATSAAPVFTWMLRPGGD